MTNRQVLLLIAAFITLTLGSFIWFIATWNADVEPQLSDLGRQASIARGITS